MSVCMRKAVVNVRPGACKCNRDGCVAKRVVLLSVLVPAPAPRRLRAVLCGCMCIQCGSGLGARFLERKPIGAQRGKLAA